MKKRNWLLAVVICLASGVKAQFSSSERVYCYEYLYTMEDGIKSQDKRGEIYFVNFQNDMIGFVKTSKEEVASKGVSYFEDEARNSLAQNVRKWKYSPANMEDYADIYPYDNSNSSSSKYTYRRQSKFASLSYSGYGVSTYWKDAFWNGDCYTFSTDRSDFAQWYLSEPVNKFNFKYGPQPSDYTTIRHYYKLIDANKLKPSVDDLW